MHRTKQVLVMKKFPKSRNLRTGKYCAQAAHASMGALLSIGKVDHDANVFVIPLHNVFVEHWLTGSFKKVVCYVSTDEELHELHRQAQVAGIPTALITDSGLTEFGGVPTITAVGIGPYDETLIETITKDLPLF